MKAIVLLCLLLAGCVVRGGLYATPATVYVGPGYYAQPRYYERPGPYYSPECVYVDTCPNGAPRCCYDGRGYVARVLP